jgi:large subunit ribosomal protein L27Ae
MRYFHKTNQQFHCPAVNVEKLWTLVPAEALEEAKSKLAGGSKQAPVIDVTEAGVYKVLGKGRLPNIPVVVKAKFFSALAEKRIKEVGGVCVLTA